MLEELVEPLQHMLTTDPYAAFLERVVVPKRCQTIGSMEKPAVQIQITRTGTSSMNGAI